VWVDATTTTLTVAFSGDLDLLRLQPGTWDGSNPDGTVAGNDLVFERAWPGTPSQAEVERWVGETTRELAKNIEWQEPDIRSHNQSLASAALQAITKRRTSLLAKRHLQASLPFNISPRPDAPLTFAPEGVRRKPSWSPPSTGDSRSYQPEASLTAEQFEDILRISRAIEHSMERTPSAFAKLAEEELRSVFLAALNAQFEGGATGETFNAEGKTDILIRYHDRNLFIGECKIWQGDVSLTKAVDQVLRYLSWRDSHAAILIFVRNKEMSSVVAKIPSIVGAHANHIRLLRTVGDAEWHYKFNQTGDSARELTLAVQAFHIRDRTSKRHSLPHALTSSRQATTHARRTTTSSCSTP